jgi:type VI secretion system Hcp family effector
MSMKKFFYILLLLLPGISFSQTTTIYMRIVDANGSPILGESNVQAFQNQIVVLSFGQENASCITISNPSCVVKTGEFSMNYVTDRSAPRLKKSLFTAEKLQVVELTFSKSGGGGSNLNYAVIRLEDVYVKGFSEGSSSDVPTCSISFIASRIGWTYRRQLPTGQLDTPVKFGWNVVTNSEWTGF